MASWSTTKPQAVHTAPNPAPGPPCSTSSLPHCEQTGVAMAVLLSPQWCTTRGGRREALAAALVSRTARSSSSSTFTRYFSCRGDRRV